MQIMAYSPVMLTKGGTSQLAETLEEEINLRWDGWLPDSASADSTVHYGVRVVALKQADYDALTLDPTTLYVITDA